MKVLRLAVAAAVLLPILLYLPTLNYGFVFDDRPLLIDNPVVRSPQGIGELFSTDLDPHARTSDASTTNYLRPLFLLLAAGLFRAFGEQPLGWHAGAIVLHGLLGGLAFVFLRREGLGVATALAAALLFSFHPAHVQSTAWVSGLQDLLLGCTAMVAFVTLRSSVDRARPRGHALVLLGLAYGVALLAKEPAIGLLLFVAAESLGMAPGGKSGLESPARRPLAELSVLAIVTVGYLAYRVAMLGNLAHSFPTAPSIGLSLVSVPIAVMAYLKDLLWPVDLFLLHHARPATSWLAPLALRASLALLAVAVAVLWLVRLRPALARPVLWFAAWLAPALALWAINPEWMVMDRYLLLPSLGLAWGLAVALPLEKGRRAIRAVVWCLLLATTAGLSLLSMRAFRDEDRFWAAAVEADPRSSTAWTEWAKRRSEAGDEDAAAQALERASDLDPRAQVPRLRRALLALRQGRTQAAVAELEDLVRRNPAYLPAWRNLVVARQRAGDSTGAERTLGEALERFPSDPQLWSSRAVLLRNDGKPDAALVAIRRALDLSPGSAELTLKEAMLLTELGRTAEATEAAGRGLLLSPDPSVRVALERLAR